MARPKLPSPSSSLSLLLIAALLSQTMVMSSSFEDQKNYYPPAGSGHYHHGGTPVNCGSPPVGPATPSTPSNHNPTPSHPSAPNGGGSPPTSGVPSVTPAPPFLPANPFPGTCYFWLTHPALIWGVVGWWGTVGTIFGLHHSILGVVPSLSVQQALSNKRADGIGALFREGTASMLNSMVNHKFPYTTQQVKNSFIAALSSDNAAATQARLFKLANEGRLKPRA